MVHPETKSLHAVRKHWVVHSKQFTMVGSLTSMKWKMFVKPF